MSIAVMSRWVGTVKLRVVIGNVALVLTILASGGISADAPLAERDAQAQVEDLARSTAAPGVAAAVITPAGVQTYV